MRDMWHGQDRIIPGDRVTPATVGETLGTVTDWPAIVGKGTVTAVYQISEGIVADIRWDRPDAAKGWGCTTIPLSQLARA
jgi:hypothetical protein